MLLKTLVEERFDDYKYPALYIGCVSCNGKCAIEGRFPISVCINDVWHKASNIFVDDDVIIEKYLKNSITSAIVFGLLEPMEQFEEIYTFIEKLRTKYNCNDDVVIYTGYTEKECSDAGWVQKLCVFNNIVIKFGRFVPNQASHYDKVLGVNLASDNQYAIKFNPC